MRSSDPQEEVWTLRQSKSGGRSWALIAPEWSAEYHLRSKRLRDAADRCAPLASGENQSRHGAAQIQAASRLWLLHGPRADGVGHAISHSVGGLVLPRAEDRPAGGCESLIDFPIATPGPFNLLAPPLSIRLVPRHVLRTAVPPAAIHEHGNPLRREDQPLQRPSAARDSGRVVGKSHESARKARLDETTCFASRPSRAQQCRQMTEKTPHQRDRT